MISPCKNSSKPSRTSTESLKLKASKLTLALKPLTNSPNKNLSNKKLPYPTHTKAISRKKDSTCKKSCSSTKLMKSQTSCRKKYAMAIWMGLCLRRVLNSKKPWDKSKNQLRLSVIWFIASTLIILQKFSLPLICWARW